MCYVYEDFKCIVFVEELKFDYFDLFFLNRFEKQQFRFEDMMSIKVIKIRDSLVKFLLDICIIEGCFYKFEYVFVFFGENFILFFVFKV